MKNLAENIIRHFWPRERRRQVGGHSTQMILDRATERACAAFAALSGTLAARPAPVPVRVQKQRRRQG